MAHPFGSPNAEQLEALKGFADRYGRKWKNYLWAFWQNGQDCYEPEGPLLRQVRNDFGPLWLKTFRGEWA